MAKIQITRVRRLLVSLDAVSFLSAEIVLVVTALAIYMGGAFSKSQKVWAPLAMLGIVLAAVALSSCGSNERYLQEPVRAMIQNAQGGMISTDDMARQIADRAANSCILPDHLSAYGRWLALAIGAVVVLMAWRPLATGGTAEYLGSLLLIVAGLMLVASAGNLVLLFLGLELISIPTYIILPMGRRDAASQESAAKYFFLSVLASAILLYGLTFVYGTTGSMQLDVIRQKLLDVRFLPDGFELFADRKSVV